MLRDLRVEGEGPGVFARGEGAALRLEGVVVAGTMSVAIESKATNRPSAEIDGWPPPPFAARRSVFAETRRVSRESRSYTNTSARSLPSPVLIRPLSEV